jgi:hypothetical protein
MTETTFVIPNFAHDSSPDFRDFPLGEDIGLRLAQQIIVACAVEVPVDMVAVYISL